MPARSVGALLPLTLFAFFVSAALSTLAVVVMNSAHTERETLGCDVSVAPGLSGSCRALLRALPRPEAGGSEQPACQHRTVPSQLSLLALFHAGVIVCPILLHALEVRHADVGSVAPHGHQVCSEGSDESPTCPHATSHCMHPATAHSSTREQPQPVGTAASSRYCLCLNAGATSQETGKGRDSPDLLICRYLNTAKAAPRTTTAAPEEARATVRALEPELGLELQWRER